MTSQSGSGLKACMAQGRGGPSEDLKKLSALFVVMPTHYLIDWKYVIWYKYTEYPSHVGWQDKQAMLAIAKKSRCSVFNDFILSMPFLLIKKTSKNINNFLP